MLNLPLALLALRLRLRMRPQPSWPLAAGMSALMLLPTALTAALERRARRAFLSARSTPLRRPHLKNADERTEMPGSPPETVSI